MRNTNLIYSRKNLSKLYNCSTFGCLHCNTEYPEYIQRLEEDIIFLEKDLSKKKNRYMIHCGAMIDCKLPSDKKIEFTRKTIDIVYKYSYGISILTKSTELLEDMEKLVEINNEKRVVIMTPICASDDYLSKKIDSNASSIKDRFEMLAKFNKRGIDTVVWISSILPFINDSPTNIKGILDLCKKVGVKAIITSNLAVTLTDETKDYFYEKMDRYPDIKEKYINQFEYSNNISTLNNIKLENIIFKFCLDNDIVYGTDNVFDFIDVMPERETLFDFEF